MDVCDQESNPNPDSQQDIVQEDKTEPVAAALKVIKRQNVCFDIFNLFFNWVTDCS